MARINVANITQRGTNAAFIQAMSTAPNVWQNHCEVIPSDAPDENYVWLGTLPIPTEKLNGRNFQTMQDFTFTVTNKTYEMSFIVDREDLEDDRHGTVNKRVGEAAMAWATFKDFQFAALLEAGGASTATFDGTSFYDTTRTIGASAAIDNQNTTAAAIDLAPTALEILAVLQTNIGQMAGFQDDRGRAGFSTQGMTNLRCVIQPGYERGFKEAVSSTQINSASNPWGANLVEYDTLPYLTAATITFYMNAVGDTRKPFIIQERTPLEVEVFNSSGDIAENDGLMVLTRQRYRFGYGDPRLSMSHIFT